MAEFAPVRTIAELRELDEGDILEGYLDGFHGGPEPEPGPDRSRAYWYGWRNGRTDAGLAKPDSAQQALAREFALLRRTCS
ncbi:MAG: hypothetical protein ACJ8AI_01440 [Rhodopila sp.]